MKIYNYQLIIEYIGTNFVGWQIQKKGVSVQGEIQKVLRKFIKKDLKLFGSGRTDSGVHALGQSAHFITNHKIKSKKILNTLNHFLKKKGISILSIKNKKKDFHSRFSAKERKYLYVIINREAPLTLYRNKAWHIRKKLNLNLMKRGAKILEGKHNFSAYRSSSCSAKSPIRTLKKIQIKRGNEGRLDITFISQSFLQQQVRSMVGCLKLLGEEKWDLSRFQKPLNNKRREHCAPPAPPSGLYLHSVKY